MRIAMWSGPRNLSTAMMYAFAARRDFAVWDEPFYAPYLLHSGIEHPMREEILLSHETNPRMVAATCRGTIPDGMPHFYMKHMALHMLPEFPMEWAGACVNVHLIRHPARVIASYAAKRQSVTAEDLGYARHLEIFEAYPGPVIDSTDIRKRPRATLSRLCAAVGLDFDPGMLRWDKGSKPFDGVWAPHWYGAVHQSDGLRPGPVPALPDVPHHLTDLLKEALPIYEHMLAQAL